MRNNNDSIWKNLDWSLLAIYGVLVLFGWLNIYAAIFDVDTPTSILNMSTKSGKQFLWITISVITIGVILLLDFKFIFTIPYLAYALTAFLLVLVVIIGSEINGAKSWIKLGGFSIQPSEFAKVGACLAVAKYLDGISGQFKYGLESKSLKLYGLILFMPALIMLQPDAGSALVYSSFIIMMCIDGLTFAVPLLGLIGATLFILTNLYFKDQLEVLLVILCLLGAIFASFHKKLDLKLPSGLSVIIVVIVFAVPITIQVLVSQSNFIVMGIYLIYIIIGVINILFRRVLINFNLLALVLAIVSLVVVGSNTIFNKLPIHHQNRLNVLKDPYIDKRGKGWNIIQSNIAISSGGVTGKGFKEGTITKGNWVPEQHTDFIFCTIGEEHGFIGTLVVIALFVTLIIRLGIMADRQKSRFSQIYGYSVLGIIFFHFLINVGMVIGLLPVIGIPLPFFSYGGSSLWSFSILIAIMVKLDMHRSQILARN